MRMAVGDYFDIKKCDEKSLTGQKWSNPKSCGKCGDDLQWELYENGQLLIFGQGNMYDYSEWDSPWYADRGFIADVEIQEGITEIGSWAFSGLEKLKKLSIPQSVCHIGENAFRGTFTLQHDPVCQVPETFSISMCEEGNGDLFYALYYTKIVSFFSQCLLETGYKEPVYCEASFRPHNEAPSTFVMAFYDEQDIVRKEYILGYHHLLESMKVYGENGHCKGCMVIHPATAKSAFCLAVYLPQEGKAWFERTVFTLSTIDFQIYKDSDIY